jgi:hypothetical protein
MTIHCVLCQVDILPDSKSRQHPCITCQHELAHDHVPQLGPCTCNSTTEAHTPCHTHTPLPIHTTAVVAADNSITGDRQKPASIILAHIKGITHHCTSRHWPSHRRWALL